jgi:IstB-like ATP binding protein
MRLAQDQHVVEELPAQRSGEALRERVHVGSADGRPHDSHTDRLEDTSEASTELCVPVADQHPRRAAHEGVASLLRAPMVGRTDEKLTTALLDRLAHHATVIATKGKSFRMRKKGANEPTTEHEATSAALPKTGRKA